MGRKARHGGGYTVRHAEELFKQSVADGKPDYRYVALAIGSAPASPPPWAMWACVELRQQEERIAARGIDSEIADILDLLVRFFDEKQQEFERDHPDARETYSPPSLRSAILHVLAACGRRGGRSAGANDDWFRDIRNAWTWEQENDLVPSSFWQLEGFHTTSRIDRVMTQSVAAELGDPHDVQLWAWITKKAIEHENTEISFSGQSGDA